MRVIIHRNHEDASNWTADYICSRINTYNKINENKIPFVLGLPTGSSPLVIYRKFINMVKEKKLSFSNVVTFNMDEYIGLPPDHTQSYRFFMEENLFKHIDINPENINLLNGIAEEPLKECQLYEEKISKAGGIELFLGGMGSDGHIAFNEPGSSLQSRTRIKTLTNETRIANARFFDGDPAKVPSTALTVGVGTVMDAREVVIIVSGSTKSRALKAAVEGAVSHWLPLSCLQMHQHAIIVCDEDAAGDLQYNTVQYFRDIEGANLL